ncbi:MAG: patatin [Vicinamibacterales bacterium]
MNGRVWLKRGVTAIAAITVVSGLVQMIVPRLILETLSSDTTPASLHFFTIVGMFMVLFGGLLLHAGTRPEREQRVPLVWAALQKFGASAAVGLGVAKAVFASIALAVAAFDLMSGLVIIALWRSQRPSV